MSLELTMKQLVFSLAVFILVQGAGIVKGQRWGDPLFYYIPATIIAGVLFWASLVFSPIFL